MKLSRKPMMWSQWGALGALLCLPVYAGFRAAAWIDWRIIASLALVSSLFAYLAYRADKRRAEAGEWRIPESTLHLAGAMGGWPGAFIAQRVHRHKTAKVPFQVVFWMTVAVHQYVALDSTLGWSISQGAAELAQRLMPGRS